MSLRPSISLDSASMFFCAASMTASRSLSCSATGRCARETWSSLSSSVGDEMHLRALRLLGEALQRAGEFGDAVFEFGRAPGARPAGSPAPARRGPQPRPAAAARRPPRQSGIEKGDGSAADLEKGAVEVHGGKPRPIRLPKRKWPVRTGRVRTGRWPSRLGTATGAMRANLNSIARIRLRRQREWESCSGAFQKIAEPNRSAR